MPYGEFPQFAEYGTKEMIRIIGEARLSKADQKIARGRLVEHRAYADIAAALSRDRSGVSRRLRQVIVPHLVEFLHRSGRG